jgi:hypothetical protein
MNFNLFELCFTSEFPLKKPRFSLYTGPLWLTFVCDPPKKQNIEMPRFAPFQKIKRLLLRSKAMNYDFL